MPRSLHPVLVRSALAIPVLLSAAASATTAPILDLYGPSLTYFKPDDMYTPTPVQNMGPRYWQRGVDVDGTLRQPVPLGWSVAGDPLGGGYRSGARMGDIEVYDGVYTPTDVDL